MRGQALEVVLDGNARGRAGVEAREVAVLKRDGVVVGDQFQQHGGDELDEVGGRAVFVGFGDRLAGWGGGAVFLGW